MRQMINAATSLGKLKASFWIPVIFSVLLVTAFITIALCAPKIDNKTVTLTDSFSLAIGQSASIDGEGLGIKFVDISADSRCPLEVLCIWQG